MNTPNRVKDLLSVASLLQSSTYLQYFFMLEHSPDQHPRPPISTPLDHSLNPLQNSQHQDPLLRKKLHGLMAQNFQLKQAVFQLQIELKSSQEEIEDLKNRWKQALEEISANDQIIAGQEQARNELEEYQRELERELEQVRNEVGVEREAVRNLMELNKNLETEAQLISEIKQKYQLQSIKYKGELQQFIHQNQQLKIQNSQLTIQLQKLLQELDSQQLQLSTRRKEMEEYQAYVLQKLNQAKTDPQFHEQCLAQKDKYYCKYLKYKQKTNIYKRERDELLGHLASVSEEVGSRSMRKYVE